MIRRLVAIVALIAPLASHAREKSTGVGNPEESVIIHGARVLKDFVQKSQAVFDNRAFLAEYPEFRALILEIGQVDPHFALAIWSDIMRAKIYKTELDFHYATDDVMEEGCPKENPDETTEPVALRVGDNMIVNTLRLSEVGADYALLHESLHKLIPSDGNRCFTHIRIRSLVDHIRINRGHLTSDLHKFRDRAGVVTTGYAFAHLSRQAKVGEDILTFLMTGHGSNEWRCELIRVGVRGGHLFLYPHEASEFGAYFDELRLRASAAEFVNVWDSSLQCHVQRNMFFEHHPVLYKILEQRSWERRYSWGEGHFFPNGARLMSIVDDAELKAELFKNLPSEAPTFCQRSQSELNRLHQGISEALEAKSLLDGIEDGEDPARNWVFRVTKLFEKTRWQPDKRRDPSARLLHLRERVRIGSFEARACTILYGPTVSNLRWRWHAVWQWVREIDLD